MTLIHVGGKLFVGTGAGDAKAAQVRKNSKVEFRLLLEKGEAKGTLRAECNAKTVTDRAVRADVYERVAFMKEFWSNPDDPRFVLLSLEPTCFEYMPAGSMQSTKVKTQALQMPIAKRLSGGLAAWLMTATSATL